ncbi:MAG TPA: response regulator [Vicinamibacterales bacterium]|nr:response regulator [Vicinamibacterales bacterium]
MNHVVRQRRQTAPQSNRTDSQPASAPRRRISVKDRPDRAPRAESRRQKSTKPESRPRILVIEDDPYAREALTLLLDYYGYDVTAASNGNDGLALVTELVPDLVVTDWRMPGLSGVALCIALRQRRDTIPIVVVTSADEVFSSEQPVNARLRKPIDPPLLNRVISDELRTQRRP